MITNAIDVKNLREKTGAGMMDCKKALVETNGDFDKAADWLRAKGLAAASKKSGRVAAEGLTSVNVKDSIGVVVEVNSETDFVAKNVQFQNLVNEITNLALTNNNLESLKLAKTKSGKTVQEEILENVATIGENMSLRRVDSITISKGVIASYIHNKVADNLGKIAVIIGLESEASNKEKLLTLGHQLAMHIAANNPQSIDATSLDQVIVEREKNVFTEQSRASGKPDNIIEKMVEGRIRKFLAEVVLLEQSFLFDDKSTITQVLQNAEKELGSPIKITKFIRYELGEGIVQEEKNFANEVASVVKG
ncbi:MAG: translation elongation factor Ts [Rickettsia endosymbiont of Bryobia graminum]|nr:translation elongation factor Ts [Rickettsia endosymbiont of Bryobia graminum]